MIATYHNVDELLTDLLPQNQQHDDIIVQIVTTGEQAVSQHFKEFKQELMQDPRINPILCFEIQNEMDTIPVEITYSLDTHLQPKIKSIIKFNNQATNCPLYY